MESDVARYENGVGLKFVKLIYFVGTMLTKKKHIWRHREKIYCEICEEFGHNRGSQTHKCDYN